MSAASPSRRERFARGDGSDQVAQGEQPAIQGGAAFRLFPGKLNQLGAAHPHPGDPPVSGSLADRAGCRGHRECDG